MASAALQGLQTYKYISSLLSIVVSEHSPDCPNNHDSSVRLTLSEERFRSNKNCAVKVDLSGLSNPSFELLDEMECQIKECEEAIRDRMVFPVEFDQHLRRYSSCLAVGCDQEEIDCQVRRFSHIHVKHGRGSRSEIENHRVHCYLFKIGHFPMAIILSLPFKSTISSDNCRIYKLRKLLLMPSPLPHRVIAGLRRSSGRENSPTLRSHNRER